MMTCLKLLRPHQWVKNGFVFLPMFFNGDFLQTSLWYNSFVAFAAFSMAASSIYCLNDLLDAPSDRLHAKKRFRPIACGAVSPVQAYVLMGGALALSVALSLLLDDATQWRLLAVVALYFFLNLAYCLKLKQIAIIDTFVIATGFVLRVLVGGWVTGIRLSHWIVLMTFLIALFLAFAKRRDDVLVYERSRVKNRKNINRYNSEFINQLLVITGVITVVCYVMYTVSPEITARFHSDYIYLTSIFVLAGIFRYLQRTLVDTQTGSPTQVLLRDRFIQACLFFWFLFFVAIIYGH